MHRIFTHKITNKLIILQYNNVSETDNNLSPGYTRYIIKSKELGYSTFDIKHLLIFSTRTIHEHKDNNNTINKTTPY